MALERLELLITALGSGAVKDIQAVSHATDDASLKTRLFSKDSGVASSALNQVGLSSLTMSQGLKGAAVAGGALVGVGLAKFALDGVEHFAALTGEVRGYQRVTGASAEDSSKLAYAVRMSGVEATSAQTGFFQLERRIAAGKDTLSKYGIEVARNRDGSVNFSATLANVADGFQKIEDPAKRDQFVMENFGKGGKELIPILSKSKEEMQGFYDAAGKHHEIFSQGDLDKGREYQVSLRELKSAVEGLGLELGETLLPIVTTLTDVLRIGIEVLDDVGNAIGGVRLSSVAAGAAIGAMIAGPWGALAGAGIGLVSTLSQIDGGASTVSEAVGEMAKKFDGLNATQASAKFQELSSDAVTLGKVTGETTTSLKVFTEISKGDVAVGQQIIDGLKARGVNTSAYEAVLAKMVGTSRSHADAEREVANVYQTVASAAQAAQAAEMGKLQADLAVQGSTLGVADALDSYNKALHDGQRADETEEEFQRRLQHANLDVQTSLFSVVGAYQKKAEAQLGPGATADAKAKADTEAQRQAFIDLAGEFPSLKGQLYDYYVKLVTATPAARNTTVGVEITGAGGLDALRQKLEAIVGTYVANVIVQSNGSYDPFGYLH